MFWGGRRPKFLTQIRVTVEHVSHRCSRLGQPIHNDSRPAYTGYLRWEVLNKLTNKHDGVCWLVRSFVSIRPTAALAGRRPAGRRPAGEWRLSVSAYLRNRLPVGDGCVYVLQMFFLFFRFFSCVKNMRQPFSGTAERIFMKLLPNDRGECGLKRRAAAWRKSCCRLPNVDDCVIYDNDSFAITRGRHARRLRYTTMRRRMDVI